MPPIGSIYQNQFINAELVSFLAKLTSLVEVQFYNIQGQLIRMQQYDYQMERANIDLSGIPAGTYTLRILADGKPIGTPQPIVKS